jgi:hypothetical protein|tara:strand:+ start:700 stop:921 length:222 start_codon:yes stop_codon:yes gene_type:complete
MAKELMLEKGIKFALSDEAAEILEKEGLEAYKEAMKARGISKNKFGGKLKKSVDGVATRGLTRATTKGFGKIG